MAAPRVRGTSYSRTMGTPPVPTEFPLAQATIPTPHPPFLGDSRGTPSTIPFTPSVSLPTTLYPSSLPFGDTLPSTKADSSFRVGFCNVGGFPALGRHNSKVSEIKTFLASHNLDLFGGCEANLNWSGLPNHLQLKEWFRSADGCRTFVAHNQHENFGPHQFGGTFWIAAGHATIHISSGTRDPTSLGRWVSCSLLGRSGKRLHVIFAYRPCANQASRIRSVHAQHSRFFAQLPRYCHPRQAFLDDLGQFIAHHRSAGDAILLLADMNGDIRHSSIQDFMSSHELHELILSKYPTLPTISTFQRGLRSGTTPIDGAWATDDLTIDSISYRDLSSSPGDHRAIILDLNLLDCIGEPRYQVVRPPGRRLNCSLPLTCRRYLSVLTSYTTRHHLTEHLDGLFALATNPTTSTELLQARLESFDLQKSEGMRHAEKHCRQFHTGLVQFSPELNFWRKRRELWHLVLRRKMGFCVKAKYIRRLARACNILNPLSASLDTATREFHTAHAQYLQQKPDHEILRKEFLLSRLNDPTLPEAHHAAIARLVKLESLRESYRRVKVLRSSSGRSISAVEYNLPSGTAQAVTREDVESILSDTLRSRFTRAHGSPFLQPPLAPLVGPFGTGSAAQEILQGTFLCPPGVDDTTKQYIEALQFPSPQARRTHVSAVLRPEDFIEHWKRAKERTSSSPSGLHFGHYKAATHSVDIAHLHARFTQLVFMTGLSLSRYQKGLQVILEKKAGNIHVDNLRAIFLFEGDFNGAMKILVGSRMIRSALTNELIPDECYGSRPGCTALQVSLQRVLTADITRQSRAILAVASVDCLTCYDSIGHPPASIACQRLGLSPSVLETIFGSIQNMRIFLRTAYGDSSTPYGATAQGLPFQGVCQGNGAGPALWLATSIPLIELLRRHGHVSKFSCPVSGLSISVVGIIYVDNCDLFVFDPQASSLHSAMAALQHNVQLWQQGLSATGGSLSHKKCSWSLLAYQRRGHRWLLHNAISSPGDITITDRMGTATPIQRSSPAEGQKVVGVVQALSGEARPALLSFQAQADSWIQTIKSHFLPRPLLWMTLSHMLWPSLRYPLGVTTFSPTQAHQATSRLYQTLLPRLGVNRHFPLALRYASPQYLGLGLPNPSWEQGISSLRLFLEHINGWSSESTLIRMSLEYLQLELGTACNPFALPYATWSFLAMDCWVKTLWRFVDEAQITLSPLTPLIPFPPRQGDAALMDLVMSLHLARPTTIAINKCRIAHQVFFCSDITNGWGDHISSTMLHTVPTVSKSLWHWPKECPSKADLRIWSSFLCDSSLSSSSRLIHPLGAWLRPSHRTDFIPFDPSTQTAFLPGHDNYWRTYRSDSSRPYRSSRLFQVAHVAVSLPSAYHLARVEQSTPTTLTLSGSSPLLRPAATLTVEWPIAHGHFHLHGALLAHALRQGTAQAICDGSYMPKRYPHLATAAWIIHPGFPSNARCHGVTQVHGSPVAINSYRAELQGMLSLLLAVNQLCSSHTLSTGSLVIGCDNKGVLWQVQRTFSYVPCATKHSDLIQAIHQAKRSCPLNLSFRYVPGHQDDFLRFEDLPLLAQLNVQADLMAKQALHLLGQQLPSPLLLPLPGLAWSLQIDDLPISGDPRPPLLAHLSRRSAMEYWTRKSGLSPTSLSLIDWALLGSALHTRPPTYRMWASKFASGHSAVGQTMARWKKWDSPLCPFCQTTDETTAHVLQCPHPTRVASWHHSVDSLRSWMHSADTDPQITHWFIQSLHSQGRRTLPAHRCQSGHSAATAQASIGFFFTLMGCLSFHWEQTQAAYWSNKGCNRSARHWARNFCLQLLHLTHSTWTSRNSLLQERLLQTQRLAAAATIRQEFDLGIRDLLPADQFYINQASPSDGFSLESVLGLPLADQQLWIHAIQTARNRGSQVTTSEIQQMQSFFHRWLHPEATNVPPS